MTQVVQVQRKQRIRLGQLQSSILVALLRQHEAALQIGGDEDRGLPSLELLAKVNDYVVVGRNVWLPSVVAQSLYGHPHYNDKAATAYLVEKVVQALEILDEIMEAGFTTRLNTRDPMVTGGFFYGSIGDQVNTQRYMLADLSDRTRIWREGHLLVLPADAELSSRAEEALTLLDYDVAHVFAQNLGRLSRGISAAQSALASQVDEASEEHDQAKALLASAHASFSRAIRLLKSHQMIEQRDYLYRDGSVEKRYYITAKGCERIYGERADRQ